MLNSPSTRSTPPDRPATSLHGFESATAEVVASVRPRFGRITLYLLAAMIASTLILITMFQIDRLVVAPGRVVAIEGDIVVQPMETAIIRALKVKVGDVVKKDQILATLDPTFAAADYSKMRQLVDSLTAETERIEAEQAGKPFVAADDSRYQMLQASNWRQRQAEYKANVDSYDQSIRADAAQIAGLKEDIEHFRNRLDFNKQIEQMHIDLARLSLDSRLQQLISSDQREEIARNLASDQNNLINTEYQLESLKAQRAAYIEKWYSDNYADLVLKRNMLDGAKEDLAKAERMRQLIDLTSPADAVVLKVTNYSVGSVTQTGDQLFTLVPLDAPLEVQVQIDPKDMGFVKIGDAVSLKFDAYEFLEHGVGNGVVTAISQDAYTQDPQTQSITPPFFLGRVKITGVQLYDVPDNFRIIPGMTLSADISVGSRTIMWYLLGGAMRSGAEAMHEP